MAAEFDCFSDGKELASHLLASQLHKRHVCLAPFSFGDQLVTLPMDDVIPATLRSTLERVCRKFFNRDAAHKSPKHQRFVELYQSTFEKDFQVNEYMYDRCMYVFNVL